MKIAEWQVKDDEIRYKLYMPQGKLQVEINVGSDGDYVKTWTVWTRTKYKECGIFDRSEVDEFYRLVVTYMITTTARRMSMEETEYVIKCWDPRKYGKYKYILKTWYNDYVLEVWDGRNRKEEYHIEYRRQIPEEYEGLVLLAYNMDIDYGSMIDRMLKDVIAVYRRMFGADAGYSFLQDMRIELDATTVHKFFRNLERLFMFRLSTERMQILYAMKMAKFYPMEIYLTEEDARRLELYEIAKKIGDIIVFD